MRTLLALLTVLLILASSIGVYSGEQQSSDLEVRAQFYLSKSSNNTLLGEVELGKNLSIDGVKVNATIKAYTKLASVDGNVNFSSKLQSNTTIVKEANATNLYSSFKLSYTDYAILAKLAQLNQVTLEASGFTKTILEGRTLNSTLNATIRPSTGNAMRDSMLAFLLAYIINETLVELKKELEGIRPNTSLEYEVTLDQERGLVLLNVNLSTYVKYNVYKWDMSGKKGSIELHVTASLKQDKTIFQVNIRTDRLEGFNMKEALNTLANLGLNTSKLEVTLDNVNTVLQSINLLLTTLNKVVGNMEMRTMPISQTTTQTRGAPGNTTTQEIAQTETRTNVEQQARSATPILILTGILIILVIALSYVILTRRS